MHYNTIKKHHQITKLKEKLKEINPDDLSPKSALSIMYEIKELID